MSATDWTINEEDVGARRNGGGGEGEAEAVEPLPIVDIAALDGLPVPARKWLVTDVLPLENVGLLTGHGASGKTTLMLQLAGATVLGRGWLNHMVEPAGPALIVCCEDDPNEIHRRLDAIAQLYGVSIKALADADLIVMSFAGRDAVMAAPDRSGTLRPTALFERLRKLAIELKPRLIGLDNAADVYAGNENARQMVRQFITTLRGLAIEAEAHVLLTLHPSLTGISSGSGISGNTAWFNSVRAQLYLKPAELEEGVEDPEIRELTALKNQYGRLAEKTLIRWHNGIFIAKGGSTGDQKAAAEQAVEALFLSLLNRLATQGRHVSHKPGHIYAPAIFAAEPTARGNTRKGFTDAMTRLFETDRIHIEEYGPPSRRYSHIRPGGRPQ